MGKRNRYREEYENHERWLVSYADFITLLFAFFVVMYSISSVNEGKYRVLSDALDEAFESHRKTLDPIQVGELERGSLDSLIVDSTSSPPQPETEDGSSDADQVQLARISGQIRELLAPYIENELVEVKHNDLWVEVEMKSGMLFDSGSAELSPNALPVLRKIAQILRELPNTIDVEGYTDNVPINTIEFPSNWELSAARAASVVHQMMRDGVGPVRMAAIGYGQYHPVADNDTEQGRFRNRRVVLLIRSQTVARHRDAIGRRRRGPVGP